MYNVTLTLIDNLKKKFKRMVIWQTCMLNVCTFYKLFHLR